MTEGMREMLERLGRAPVERANLSTASKNRLRALRDRGFATVPPSADNQHVITEAGREFLESEQ